MKEKDATFIWFPDVDAANLGAATLEEVVQGLAPCIGPVKVHTGHQDLPPKGSSGLLVAGSGHDGALPSGKWNIFETNEATGPTLKDDPDGQVSARAIGASLWGSGVWYHHRRSAGQLNAILQAGRHLIDACPRPPHETSRGVIFAGVYDISETSLTLRDLERPLCHVGALPWLSTSSAHPIGRLVDVVGTMDLTRVTYKQHGIQDLVSSSGFSIPLCQNLSITLVVARGPRTSFLVAVIHEPLPVAGKDVDLASDVFSQIVSRRTAEIRHLIYSVSSNRTVSRERFEKWSSDLVNVLPAALVFDPELAGEAMRLLAVEYVRYIRATYGTRLSPKLKRHMEQEASSNTNVGRKIEEGKVPGPPKPGSSAEAREQWAFLGRMVGLTHLLSDNTAGKSPRLEQSPLGETARLQGMGQRIPTAARPFRRLFCQMLLLDLCGTQSLLVRAASSKAFLEAMEGMLGPLRKPAQMEEATWNSPGERLIQWVQTALPPPEHGAELEKSAMEQDKQPIDRKTSHSQNGAVPGPVGWFLPGDSWREPANASCPPGDTECFGPDPDDTDQMILFRLQDTLCWWLGFTTALETGALRYRHVFGDRLSSSRQIEEYPPFQAFRKLWDTTADTMADNLRSHKRWNDPWKQLEALHAPASGEETQQVLHVDSLWLQFYLLRSLMENMPAEDVAFHYFPGAYPLIIFLEKVGDLVAYTLWAELTHELRRKLFGLFARPRIRNAVEAPDLPANPVQLDRYTDALIGLVAAYAHHVIELPVEIQVEAYLRRFLDRQALLYLLKEHYRDHLYHVIDVFLFGDFLLRCRLGRERVLVRDVLEELLAESIEARLTDENREPSREPPTDLLQNWCIAGLFHDLGYSFLMYGRFYHELGEEIQGGPLRRFVQGMRQALTGELQQLETAISKRFKDLVPRPLDGLLPEDHGILSELMVEEHLKGIDWGANEDQLVRRFWPALMAVFLHNLPHRRIAVSEQPLAYLLVLCDELQDWGRPRVRLAALRRDLVWAVASPANWQVRSHPVLGELLMAVEGRQTGDEFALPGPTGTTASRGERYDAVNLDLIQVYDPADPTLLDPIFLWVGKTLALERLHHEKAPWRPRLLIITGVPERLQRLELDYKEILDRIAVTARELNLDRFTHATHAYRHDLLQRGLLRGEGSEPEGRCGKPQYLASLALAMEQYSPASRVTDWVILDFSRLTEDQPLRGFRGGPAWAQLVRERDSLLETAERHNRPGLPRP